MEASIPSNLEGKARPTHRKSPKFIIHGPRVVDCDLQASIRAGNRQDGAAKVHLGEDWAGFRLLEDGYEAEEGRGVQGEVLRLIPFMSASATIYGWCWRLGGHGWVPSTSDLKPWILNPRPQTSNPES